VDCGYSGCNPEVGGLGYYSTPQMPRVAPDVFKKAKREMKGEQQKLL
jgi:hypothetical protein